MASPYYIYCPGHQKESGHRRNFLAAVADPSCHADWFERKIPIPRRMQSTPLGIGVKGISRDHCRNTDSLTGLIF